MNIPAAYLPTDSGQHGALTAPVTNWAGGCPSCRYGIVSAPELTGAASLYLERLVQAIAKDITFCDCQAGTRYRVYLLNCRQKLIEEARKDPRMTAQAARLSHPDIDIAQWHLRGKADVGVPTMHYESQQEPAT